jgi:O-antigen/teichoic acid export membrane protein
VSAPTDTDNWQTPGVLRSLSAVSLNKVVQVAGLVVTVVLVPRLFGAEDYGRFAFVLSLSYLGQILGDFGTLDVMGRFVPSMPVSEASRLYMRTLAFKIVVGLLAGLVTAGTALALGQWMRLEWAVLTGLGVALHIIAWVPFQFALGLNRVGTWMAEQAWRQWALLGLLLVLLPLWGLSGALLAIVLMEIIFCVLGIWWVRDYWQVYELRLDWDYLWPFLAFGATFFMANLAIVALYRSGPVLVEILTRQPIQTGYFNLALGLFMMAYVTVSQFAQSLIPTLSGFRAQGQSGQLESWLHNFVRYSWLAGWFTTIAVWLLADWGVPLVFGEDFAPAAAVLKWISLAIPLTALLWAGNTLSTVLGRGRIKFGASLVALLVFLVAALWLTPAYGAVGAAVALAFSTAANVFSLGLLLRSEISLNWPMLLVTSLAGVAIVGVIASIG